MEKKSVRGGGKWEAVLVLGCGAPCQGWREGCDVRFAIAGRGMVRDRDRVPSRVHDVPVGVAQGGGGGVVWADVTRKIIMSSGYGLQLKAWVWSVVDKRGSCGLSGAAFIKEMGPPCDHDQTAFAAFNDWVTTTRVV